MTCDRSPKRLNNGKLNDSISFLPRNICDNIMDRLPLKEAARLCVLSKRWNRMWVEYPNLKLDNQFFVDVLSKKVLKSYEFNQIVSKIMLSHEGPIPRFFLSIPDLYGQYGLDPRFMCSPEICSLISHLSRNGIREISLHNHGRLLLRLPYHLFNCVELEKLELYQFEVNIPPSFESFKSITRVALESVTFIGHTLERFISRCPSLETLVVTGLIDGGSLVINGPNLKLIEIVGTFTSIRLKGCQGLLSFTIGCDAKSQLDGNAQELVEFLCRECKLQELNFRGFFYKFLGPAGFLAMSRNTFDHLRKLQLSPMHMWDSESAATAIRILRSCPNLEELSISIATTKTADVAITCNPKYGLFQRLRTVFLMYPTGSKTELNFITFLLAYAPVLEKLYIHRVPDLEARLSTIFLQFSRASTKAEFVFFDPLPKTSDIKVTARV